MCVISLLVIYEFYALIYWLSIVEKSNLRKSGISLAHGESYSFHCGLSLFLGWYRLVIFSFADTQSAENIIATALLTLHLEG